MSELFGATAVGNLGYGESVVRTEKDKIYFNFGTTLDFDLHAKTPVPLALALGYRYDSFPESGDEVSTKLSMGLLRISYNGRPDFSLGLELSSERVNSESLQDPFYADAVKIDFRYFF